MVRPLWKSNNMFVVPSVLHQTTILTWHTTWFLVLQTSQWRFWWPRKGNLTADTSSILYLNVTVKACEKGWQMTFDLLMMLNGAFLHDRKSYSHSSVFSAQWLGQSGGWEVCEEQHHPREHVLTGQHAAPWPQHTEERSEVTSPSHLLELNPWKTLIDNWSPVHSK